MAKIETLADWNQALACCAEMPSCPVPIIVAETIQVELCGFSLPEFDGITDEQRDIRFKELKINRHYLENSVDTWVSYSDNVYVISHKDSVSYSIEINEEQIRIKSNENNYCNEKNKSLSINSKSISFSVREYNAEMISYFGYDPSTYQTETSFYEDIIKASGENVAQAVGTENVSWRDQDRFGNITSVNYSYPYPYWGVNYVFDNAKYKHQGDYSFKFEEKEERLSDNYDVERLISRNSYSKIETITVSYTEKLIVTKELSSKKFPDDAEPSIQTQSTLQPTTGTKSRLRFQIPPEHEGSYFKISWNYELIPEGWDQTVPNPAYTGGTSSPPIPKPGRPVKKLIKGGTWEWKGPGRQDNPNGDSRKSPWFEIPVPDVIGIIKLVNIRFECYHGPYGTKPQITGESSDA